MAGLNKIHFSVSSVSSVAIITLRQKRRNNNPQDKPFDKLRAGLGALGNGRYWIVDTRKRNPQDKPFDKLRAGLGANQNNVNPLINQGAELNGETK